MIWQKRKKFLILEIEKGSVLYYSIVILSILLAMVLGLSSIIVEQIRTVKTMGDSVQSFYAADSGIEKALKISNQPISQINFEGFLDLNGNDNKDLDEPTYQVEGTSVSTSSCPELYYQEGCIRSIGFYLNTKRAIQIGR